MAKITLPWKPTYWNFNEIRVVSFVKSRWFYYSYCDTYQGPQEFIVVENKYSYVRIINSALCIFRRSESLLLLCS